MFMTGDKIGSLGDSSMILCFNVNSVQFPAFGFSGKTCWCSVKLQIHVNISGLAKTKDVKIKTIYLMRILKNLAQTKMDSLVMTITVEK